MSEPTLIMTVIMLTMVLTAMTMLSIRDGAFADVSPDKHPRQPLPTRNGSFGCSPESAEIIASHTVRRIPHPTPEASRFALNRTDDPNNADRERIVVQVVADGPGINYISCGGPAPSPPMPRPGR